MTVQKMGVERRLSEDLRRAVLKAAIARQRRNRLDNAEVQAERRVLACPLITIRQIVALGAYIVGGEHMPLHPSS